MAAAAGLLVSCPIVQLAPNGGDVAGLPPHQQRRNFPVDQMHQRRVVAGAASSVLRLTPSDSPALGLNPKDRRIKPIYLSEVAAMLLVDCDGEANPTGLYMLNAHRPLGRVHVIETCHPAP